MIGIERGRSSSPSSRVFMPSARQRPGRRAHRRPARARRPGRASTRPQHEAPDAALAVGAPAAAEQRDARPIDPVADSESTAGSATRLPSTAAATTRMVPIAKPSKIVLPERNMPDIAAMTVRPLMATRAAGGRCGDRGSRRGSRAARPAPRGRGGGRTASSRRRPPCPTSRITLDMDSDIGTTWLATPVRPTSRDAGERQQHRDAGGDQRAEREDQDQQRDRQRRAARPARSPCRACRRAPSRRCRRRSRRSAGRGAPPAPRRSPASVAPTRSLAPSGSPGTVQVMSAGLAVGGALRRLEALDVGQALQAGAGVGVDGLQVGVGEARAVAGADEDALLLRRVEPGRLGQGRCAGRVAVALLRVVDLDRARHAAGDDARDDEGEPEAQRPPRMGGAPAGRADDESLGLHERISRYAIADDPIVRPARQHRAMGVLRPGVWTALPPADGGPPAARDLLQPLDQRQRGGWRALPPYRQQAPGGGRRGDADGHDVAPRWRARAPGRGRRRRRRRRSPGWRRSRRSRRPCAARSRPPRRPRRPWTRTRWWAAPRDRRRARPAAPGGGRRARASAAGRRAAGRGPRGRRAGRRGPARRAA